MSDKPGKSSFLPKAIVIVVALAAIAYGVVVYMRPTAKVETVVSGTAVDAKPGSVTVKEEYSMQMKAAIGGARVERDIGQADLPEHQRHHVAAPVIAGLVGERRPLDRAGPLSAVVHYAPRSGSGEITPPYPERQSFRRSASQQGAHQQLWP